MQIRNTGIFNCNKTIIAIFKIRILDLPCRYIFWCLAVGTRYLLNVHAYFAIVRFDPPSITAVLWVQIILERIRIRFYSH